jgi:predicted ATPase
LERLRAARHEVLTTEFNMALAQGLAAIGRVDEGKALIEQSLRRVETSGEMFYMPELLRVKAGLLRSTVEPDLRGAETCFNESLDLSRRQGARGWELRAASDFAKLLADHGDSEKGRTLLRSVYQGFSEGFETAELKAAEGLLARLK